MAWWDQTGQKVLDPGGFFKVPGGGSNSAGPRPKDMIFENSGFSTKDKKGNVIENPLLNPDGSVKSQFQLNYDSILPQVRGELDGVSQDMGAYNAIRDRALGTGTSPWLALQQQGLGLKLDQMRDDGQVASGSANAQAMSQLARTGGLSGGARERVARFGAQNANAENQRIARFGAEQGNQFQVQDELMKQQALNQLSGLDQQNFDNSMGKANTYINALGQDQLGKAKMDEYNLATSKDELTAKRLFDTNQYNEKMRAWGAGKTADAQANAKGKK